MDEVEIDANGATTRKAWPEQAPYLFRPPPVGDPPKPADVMVITIPAGIGLQPVHSLTPAVEMILPNVTPCRGTSQDAALAFSDHCALIVSFWED